jgi:hypothetical protein
MFSNVHAVLLEVDVTNATNDKKLVSYPFTVKISSIDSQNRPHNPKTLKFQTGQDGGYESEIAVETGKMIEIEVNYRGISYYSRAGEVKDSTEKHSFNVPVYDISDKKENIIVSERNITLVPKNEGLVQVFEKLKIENSGSTTYVGKFNDELDVTQVLYIPMPRGYELTGLRGITSSRVYTLSGGIVSKEEIKPGIHEIFMYYNVLSDTGFFDFSLFTQKDAPEIRFVSLYFPVEKKWKIKSSDLKSAGEQVFGNRSFNIWKGSVDSALRIKIYGPTYEGIISRWFISILLIFSVLLTVLYLCRSPIKMLHLKREKKRLETVLSGIKHEASGDKMRGDYLTFLQIIRGRLKEIEHKLGT